MAERNIRVWANWMRAIEWLPDDASKGGLLLKIMRYAFDGTEPDIEQCEGSAWEMIKTAIDGDLQAQKNGSKGGNGRGNKTPSKTPLKTPSKTPEETPSKRVPIQNMNMNMNQNHESEHEHEPEHEPADEPAKTEFPDWDDTFAAFAAQVLEAWNATTGQSVPYFTQGAWFGLRAAFDNGASLDDVTRVINSKNMEWSKTKKTRAWLKPSTVLGEKLCEYLQEGVVDDGFEQYA